MTDTLFWWTGAAFWLAIGMGLGALLVVTVAEYVLGPTPTRHWPHRNEDDPA